MRKVKKDLTSQATFLQGIQKLANWSTRINFFWTVHFFTEKHTEFDQQDHFKELTLCRMILQSILDVKSYWIKSCYWSIDPSYWCWISVKVGIAFGDINAYCLVDCSSILILSVWYSRRWLLSIKESQIIWDSSRARQAYGKGGHRAGISPKRCELL